MKTCIDFRWMVVLLGICWWSVGCNHLFYYPDANRYSTPLDFQIEFEEVTFSSADGTVLSGWFIPAVDSENVRGTIIQFHGNAENMSSHYRSLLWLTTQQYNLFAFDYRGFGKSKGEPDLHGPVQDSVAAIEYIRNRPDVDPERIVLLGQSLGGALAIAAAGTGNQSGIRAIVAESTFSSYQRVTRDKLGEVTFTWPFQWPLSLIFIRDTYSPEDYVAQLSPIPLLFIHSSDDPIVAAYHSETLYEAAQEPKFLWKIVGNGHTDAFIRYGNQYRDALLLFLEKEAKL